jgi:Kef-type K+ transport system membrane component KefB
MEINTSSLLLTAFIAVIAPLICELPLGLKLPMVVLEVILGIVVGPHVLGWAKPEGILALLGELGLIFLFFLAGMESDVKCIRGTPLLKAGLGWGLSVVIALAIAIGLYRFAFVDNYILIGAIMTTTTLGTLMPILRDSGELETKFGSHVLAAGMVGELGPVVLVSIVFTRDHRHWLQTFLLVTFIFVVIGAAAIALWPSPPRILALIGRTMESASQLPVRIAILVLMLLVTLANKFGLDMILGAFGSGMVVGLATKGEQGRSLHHKLDAIGFGFLIPMFFVASGMRFDLRALLDDPRALLRVPLYLLFFLIVRGAPTLLYRDELGKDELLPFALYSSTALPFVIALTELGVSTGRMRTDNAAALVGAGMLSVLLFPMTAMALRKKAPLLRTAQSATQNATQSAAQSAAQAGNRQQVGPSRPETASGERDMGF